jgi:hypothetical protein
MTDKEKIRAEIIRLYNQSLEHENRQVELGLKSAACTSYGKEKACKELLSFIDSMQEELISEDLKKAARKYAGIPEDSPHDLKYCVQDKKAKYDAVLYGANWQKEQMMKNAKDGVITFDYYGDNDKIYGCIAHDSFSLEELGLKDGDKVKLIIIKEDEQ